MTRVLVVEDSPDIARLVQRSLLLEGYEVDVATDAGRVRWDPARSLWFGIRRLI